MQATPLPQPPGFPLSPVTSSRSQKLSGLIWERGGGWQGSGGSAGLPGSRRDGGGKTLGGPFRTEKGWANGPEKASCLSKRHLRASS